MRLPNPERAFVDPVKLVGYCLSDEHPRGRNKARVFRSALGITAGHADILRSALLAAAVSEQAEVGEGDSFGQRFVVDFWMSGPTGRAAIRSAWIVLAGEDFPRLTTCYVRTP